MLDLSTVNGPLGIKLVNDYLFRALLQKNNNVLKAMIASLLHINPQDIHSVKIENEIVLGHSIEDKEFVLDIRVLMNNNTVLNIEMQVINLHNWVERSMSYMCRSFDNLDHGDDYVNVKPAIQIGLLDYTLFPDAPEFYATYYLMNEKSHRKYSDKLRLSVLDLTRIDLATDEDKLYEIDHWASLFKSKTWEDLKMLAQNDEVMADAVSTIYDITQDNMLREEIRAREERLAVERRLLGEKDSALMQVIEVQNQLKNSQQQLTESQKQLAETQKQIAESKKQIAESEKQIAEKDTENARLRNLLIANGINPDTQ